MATAALDVRIASPHNQRVELARLTSTLTEVRLALNEIDHIYVLRGSRPKWVVSSMRSSPESLLVRLTADSARTRDLSSLLLPADALVSGVDALQQVPEVPQYYTESTVERVLKIGRPGQGVSEVALAAVNSQPEPAYIPVSQPVMDHAREAVRGKEKAIGSVAGWLDQISGRRVGKGVIVVSLFDPLTRRAVNGYLPAEMERRVHDLWLTRVLAIGEVTRNERGQAVRISITGFDKLPQGAEDRATTDELLGIAPDWLVGQSVEDYLREARRG